VNAAFLFLISLPLAAARVAAIARDLDHVRILGVAAVVTAIVRVAAHSTAAALVLAPSFISHKLPPFEYAK